MRVDAAAASPRPGPAVLDGAPTRALLAEPAAPAWPLTVTVLDRERAPIAGAAVQVWVAPSIGKGKIVNRRDRAFLREDVAVGQTGQNGVFRTSLDGFRDRSAVLRGSRYVWVEAKWPHGRAVHRLLDLPRTLDRQALTVELVLARRSGVVGKVVDHRGEPIESAQVGSVQLAAMQYLGDKTDCDEDGAFRLDLPEADESRPTELLVFDARHGVATVALPARTAARAEPELVDVGTIVLSGADAVQGRLELGDGSPLAHWPVGIAPIDPALAGDLDACRRAFYSMSGERRPDHAQRDGRFVQHRATSVSLADGTFRFAGLDPSATYAVRGGDSLLRGAQGIAVARAGDEGVRLRVDAQLLTIEPRDEHGVLVPGVSLLAEGYDPQMPHSSRKKHPGFPESGIAVGNLPFAADPDGRLMLLSPFGWIWRIGTSDDGVRPTFLRHDALPGVFRATRTLVLQAETRFGKLHLVVVDEEGKPIHHGATLKALECDLEHNDSRMVPPSGGRTWELPAGRWHLHVLLGKEVAYSPAAESYVRGFHEEVVTIEDGQTTEVRVVAKPAGMVAFRLRSAQPPATGWRDLRIETAGREVAVLAYDHEPGLPGARAGDLPVLFATKQALPPGRHTFLIQADGHEPATCEVDVVADQLTSVHVDLVAR